MGGWGLEPRVDQKETCKEFGICGIISSWGCIILLSVEFFLGEAILSKIDELVLAADTCFFSKCFLEFILVFCEIVVIVGLPLQTDHSSILLLLSVHQKCFQTLLVPELAWSK